MKLFLYKTIIVIIAIIVVFKLTIGQIIRGYEDKIMSLTDKKSREEIVEKIKEVKFLMRMKGRFYLLLLKNLNLS